MPVTVRDIARRVNVSHTMVSRALGETTKSLVSAGNREMILKAAKELGYRPNHAARTLATGQSYVIALQVFDIESPYAQRVARRLTDLLKKENYDLIVQEFTNDLQKVRWSIDGAFLLGRRDYHGSDMRCPIVAIGSFLLEIPDSVVVNLYPAARDAMANLIDMGRRRIVLLSMDEDNLTDGRTRAYLDSTAAAGLPQLIMHATHAHQIDGWRALSEFMAEHPAPDAVFCQNDQLAEGCYRAIREAGLRIPEDVAVVGCDGIDKNQYLFPSLSSIQQPLDEMCAFGWEIMRQRLADPVLPRQRTTLDAQFVRRASS